ncbi:DUF3617 family protein [Variovorax dokdonensis]|uniref:DUF3617 family protein n=1 Tax=Variovorax dokdonensis TaxID=344883 RepID=A0ABT7NG18_9BURK|nr:DUF3617 family protein [Variovorax dokdonensis]MDM0046903.1 DUF3617 family protein [Variovorax dokdonensis]
MSQREAAAFRLAALAMLCLGAWHTASAMDYPPRKPGLWEMSIEGARGREHVVQQCIDARTDAMLREMGEQRGDAKCTKKDVRKEGAKIVIDSVCQMGKTTATSHAEISGDFGTDYRMETQTTYSPPLRGRAEGKAVIHAKWSGPCKADQKPGDMIMPGGMKINVQDMQAGRMPGAPGMPRQ